MKKTPLLFALCSLLSVGACVPGEQQDVPYNQEDFQQGGPDAPFLNDRTGQFMESDNQYFTTGGLRPKTLAEKTESNDKWETSKMETRWQEYKGTMVRVEILLGSADLREMRLKMIQNANGMDIDGDAQDVLGKVADYEMKKVCGRNANNYVMIYDKPSFEVLRPNAYFDYVPQNEGSTMREYGFRCVYNN